jgi:UDP-glucose 6-dehydrogenase
MVEVLVFTIILSYPIYWKKLNRLQPKNKHLIIGCTVMPKYIESVGKMSVSNCEGCSLSYNPEFVAQGDIVKGLAEPNMYYVVRTRK